MFGYFFYIRDGETAANTNSHLSLLYCLLLFLICYLPQDHAHLTHFLEFALNQPFFTIIEDKISRKQKSQERIERKIALQWWSRSKCFFPCRRDLNHLVLSFCFLIFIEKNWMSFMYFDFSLILLFLLFDFVFPFPYDIFSFMKQKQINNYFFYFYSTFVFSPW